MKKIFAFLFLTIFLSFSAQENLEWLKLKKYQIAVLPDSLDENSTLDFFRGRLFTINDSGGTSEIFEIDKKSGKLKNKFQTNLKNEDWEAMTSDSANFYVGEFGNNLGSRKNLKVYKIPFDSIEKSRKFSNAQEIPFYYPEQNDFTKRNTNNDFDAEAMIFLNGKIHLFTKEWVSKKTTHYIIDPEISENQAALKVETFQTDYVVTDAAYFKEKLYLIGYTKKGDVYLTIFKESESGIFFTEKPKKYYLGNAISIGQIEGISVDEEGIYISGEEFKTPLGKVKQPLYFVPKKKVQ